MTDTQQPPKIEDWATQFDHTHPDYAAHAPEIWDDLRGRCPVAHSDAFGGTWLPTRHEDVAAIAHDTEHFTSEGVIVSPWKPEGMAPAGFAPPITSDPPFHAVARKLLLPAFAPRAIARWEDATRTACRQLLDELLAEHTGQTLEKVKHDTDRDFIMSAPEAKNYGIVDDILTNRELSSVGVAAGVG